MKNNKKLIHTYYIDNEIHSDIYYGTYDNGLFITHNESNLLSGLALFMLGSAESNQTSLEIDIENNLISFLQNKITTTSTDSEDFLIHSKGTMDNFYIESQTDLHYITQQNNETHIFELI